MHSLLRRERGDDTMTQELAVGALLAGFLGIVWAMAVAVIHDDDATEHEQDRSQAGKSEPGTPTSSQRKTALAA
jgi:hypothetical protein